MTNRYSRAGQEFKEKVKIRNPETLDSRQFGFIKLNTDSYH
jgi:hypothetical protein